VMTASLRAGSRGSCAAAGTAQRYQR
jgi:hypothetical protein